MDSFQAFASELGLSFDQNAFAFESYLAVMKQIKNISQIFSERFPESDGFIDEDSYQPFFEQKVQELTERVQNATDVNLEDNADFYEALDAYNALADQVNLDVTKLEQQMNRLFVFDERGLDFEDVATYASNQLTVTVSIFEPDDITFLLSECGDLVLQGDDAAIRAYNDLVGTQAFEAALQAVYDNYYEQQLAQEQVQSTLYAALLDLGYEFDSESDLVANQLLELAQIAENGLINPLPDSQGKIIQVLDLMPYKLAHGVEVWQWQKDIELLEKMDSIVVLGTDFFEKNDDFGDVAQMLTAAEMSFSAFGYSMVTAIDLLLDGVATGEIYDSSDPNQLPDVFVFSMIPLHTVENFDGKDLFYFGNLVQDFIPLTEPDNFDFMVIRSPVVLGGQDDRIEIFAQQLGDDTRLYIEKDTAAGNTNDWDNLIEMTLLGVQVRDLVFDKGILSFNQDVLLG